MWKWREMNESAHILKERPEGSPTKWIKGLRERKEPMQIQVFESKQQKGWRQRELI
jgi:hypothetical protein